MKQTLTIDYRMHMASGIGTYIKKIVPFLVDTFELILLGKENEIKTYASYSNVKIIECTSKIYSLKEQLELYRKNPKSDFFWSPHYNIPLLPIKASKRIVTIHDVYHFAFFKTLNLQQKLYAKFVINQAVKKAT